MFDKVQRILEDLMHLENNWDGEGSPPVSTKAADRVIKLLAEEVFISPLSGGGGCQIEWRLGNKYMEIAINSVGEIVSIISSGDMKEMWDIRRKAAEEKKGK